MTSLLGGDMKKALLVLFGAASGFIALAFADLPTPGGPPSLEFRTIPIEGAPASEHKVTPYRLFDKMIVTVWDPVSCGQRPVNPAFSIQGDKLFLSYALSPAPSEAKHCTLISEFDVLNVPHRDLVIEFAGGPEPYVVATLKKCPYYKPTSDDIWECLAPAKP
jgi:hypothetical protein